MSSGVDEVILCLFDRDGAETQLVLPERGSDVWHGVRPWDSAFTDLAVLLVLRTQRAFFRSRPGCGLLVSSAAIAPFTLALPYTGRLADVLGIEPMPAKFVSTLLAIDGIYVLVAEFAKHVFYRSRVRA